MRPELIAGVGRAMSVTLLAHYSMLGRNWPIPGRAGVVAALAALFVAFYVATLGTSTFRWASSVPACLVVAAGIAIPVTLVEGVLGGGVDNLVLPALAAGLLSLTR